MKLPEVNLATFKDPKVAVPVGLGVIAALGLTVYLIKGRGGGAPGPAGDTADKTNSIARRTWNFITSPFTGISNWWSGKSVQRLPSDGSVGEEPREEGSSAAAAAAAAPGLTAAAAAAPGADIGGDSDSSDKPSATDEQLPLATRVYNATIGRLMSAAPKDKPLVAPQNPETSGYESGGGGGDGSVRRGGGGGGAAVRSRSSSPTSDGVGGFGAADPLETDLTHVTGTGGGGGGDNSSSDDGMSALAAVTVDAEEVSSGDDSSGSDIGSDHG